MTSSETAADTTCTCFCSLDPASGGTSDYAYGAAGIKYTFTPELRGPGFDPEPENIDPGWREFWAGCKAMVAEIENIEGLN